MTPDEAYDSAARHFEAGRLAEAEALGRQILAADPDHYLTLHMLGLLAYRAGRHALVIPLVSRAIALHPTPGYYNTLGIAWHGLRRFEEAAACYRSALQLQPDYTDAQNNLGNALVELSRNEEAVAVFAAALRTAPHRPDTHSNFGAVLSRIGDLDGAEREYRAALALQPGFADAHYNLGNLLAERRRWPEAVAEFRAAIECQPDYGLAFNNLGIALGDLGERDEAVTALREAVRLMPAYPEGRNNLACALLAVGKPAEAIAAARAALQLRPSFPQACNTLANALGDHGQTGEAIDAARMALQLKPDYAEAHTNLGTLFAELGQYDAAISAFRTSLSYHPQLPEAHYNLGNALRDQGRMDASMDAYREAIRCRPDLADAHLNLGNGYKSQGRFALAYASFRTAMALQPHDASYHSNLVYTMQLDPGCAPDAIRDECRHWNHRHAEPLRSARRPHANDRDPDRRLRIGYVSPDFGLHSVSFFLEPLLAAHDRARVETYCYSSVKKPDSATERFRSYADAWRDILRTPSDEAAEMIRRDGIDILVDLSMHSALNRLLMFSRKPAPVQVSWLAYPGTTGVETIDYRLTDAHMEPPGAESESASGEKPMRLPDSWCCFQALGDFPDPGSLPALRSGYVTFGSLHNFCKVHDGVLRCWARMLEAVPHSRLIMLCPEGECRARVASYFAEHGVSADRVEYVGNIPWQEYLATYHRIDLGLDTFPANGITITCQALWMGVPVVTCAGGAPVSRAGLGLLHTLGLPELAAASEEEYIERAVALARDLPRLVALRATMRARMLASPLMDAPRFARNVEASYRQMWHAWVQ